MGLSQFVVTRVLSSPDIQAEYAHGTVPHHYKSGYEDALKQFQLKKFLQIVLFLDMAKSKKIIMHDPCLFRKDSKVKVGKLNLARQTHIDRLFYTYFKASKDLLVAFSRDFLAREGDVCKHLAYLGYQAVFKQTALNEFDYGVTDLANDLRDGVRLW